MGCFLAADRQTVEGCSLQRPLTLLLQGVNDENHPTWTSANGTSLQSSCKATKKKKTHSAH